MGYLENLFDMKNKVVVITGATGQLGSEFCRAFHQVGALVVGLDLSIDRNLDPAVLYHQVDISDRAQVHDILEKITRKYKGLDVLINNAGVSTFEPFEQRLEERFDWVVDVNLKGTFFCIQALASIYNAHDFTNGSVVNIGSIFGVISPDFRNYTDCDRKSSEVYGATKAGIIQMTKYFAVHLADRNIRVNAVSPGGIFNPSSPQGEDFRKNYAFRCPMKRMADPEEMIGAVLYLSSHASSYTTGQNIVVDGGLSCW